MVVHWRKQEQNGDHYTTPQSEFTSEHNRHWVPDTDLWDWWRGHICCRFTCYKIENALNLADMITTLLPPPPPQSEFTREHIRHWVPDTDLWDRWRGHICCRFTCHKIENALMLAGNYCSDLFTILGWWVLELAVSHINEFNCKLMSPEHYF